MIKMSIEKQSVELNKSDYWFKDLNVNEQTLERVFYDYRARNNLFSIVNLEIVKDFELMNIFYISFDVASFLYFEELTHHLDTIKENLMLNSRIEHISYYYRRGKIRLHIIVKH